MNDKQLSIIRIVGFVVMITIWAAFCYFFKDTNFLKVVTGSIAGWQVGHWIYDFVSWIYPYNDEEYENE